MFFRVNELKKFKVIFKLVSNLKIVAILMYFKSQYMNAF